MQKLSYEKNVLLITNYFSQKPSSHHLIATDALYNVLKQIKTVNITAFDVFDPALDNRTLSYLKKFDLIAIDFMDGGYDIAPRFPNFTRNLMTYIKDGGALFTGHDQFDSVHKGYITPQAIEMLSLLGFIHKSGPFEGSTAYFEKSAIQNSIFLTNYVLDGDQIKIAGTHQTYSTYDNSCTTCKVVLKFEKDGPDSSEYLVTNRVGKGKIVNIRAGHSSGFTEDERKIFLSSILWLLYDI